MHREIGQTAPEAASCRVLRGAKLSVSMDGGKVGAGASGMRGLASKAGLPLNRIPAAGADKKNAATGRGWLETLDFSD